MIQMMALVTLQPSTYVLAEDKQLCLSNQGGTTLDISLRPCSDAVDEGFFISINFVRFTLADIWEEG